MTAKEAMAFLENLKQGLDNYCGLNDKGKSAFNMAVLALESYSGKDTNVEDTISRQDAIEALHDEIVRRRINEDSNDDGTLDEFDTEAILRRLPPAHPEQKTGKWIPVHPLQSDDCGAYMCSKCKTGMWEIRPSVYHYCPNCGKPMKRGEQDEINRC